MIGYLQGRPLRTGTDQILLLVQGVGYELSCSTETLRQIDGKAFVELWVYTHVREDALHLFGFASEREKALFLALLKVNGVGPKSALNILAGTACEQIEQWIEEANVAALTKLPKLGKKTAEQIVLTLQGKLVRASKEEHAGFTARSQIVSALVNLGFRIGDVEKVVDQMTNDTDLERGLRQGLSALTS